MNLPDWARRARVGWHWTGERRPPFAVDPRPGQESVWDYPRPPVLDPVDRHVVVRLGDTVIADTRRAIRVLETAHPPSWYIPPDDVASRCLTPASGSSGCEWKGVATYWTVRSDDGRTEERGAWSYEEPFEEFAAIRGHLSFYPSRFECAVDGEPVLPQAGGFYGGWVTPELVGPFKGEPGSAGW
jgi:uncharacterized protein (DUF427 family)